MTIETESKSLSDFWRVRKSYDRSIELRNLLEGMKSIIEIAADEGDFQVEWGASSHIEHSGVDAVAKGYAQQQKKRVKKVQLSYLPFRDIDTPFSGDRVDVVTGYAAHEAGHQLRHTSAVRKLTPDERDTIGMAESIERCLRNTLEDVVIDRHLYHYAPILKKYIRAGRDWDLETPEYKNRFDDLRSAALSDQFTKLDLINLWILYELYNVNTADKLTDFSEEILNSLLALAEITDIYCKKKGLVDAEALMSSIWNQLSSYPDPNPSPQQQGNGEQSEQGISFGNEPQQDAEGDKDGDEEKSEQGAGDKGDGEENESEEDTEGDKGDTDEQEDSEESEEDGDVDTDDKEKDESKEDKEDSEESGGEQGQQEISEEERQEQIDEMYDNTLRCRHTELHDIPEDVLDEFNEAVLLEREDITKDMEEEFKEEGLYKQQPRQRHTGVIVERAADSVKSMEEDVIAHSINQLFQFRAQRMTRYSRGIEEGRISQSRLHRAGYGSKHIYERKDIKDDIDLNICVLVDSSSSVKSNWPIIERVSSSLAQGLSHKKGVKLCILAYRIGYDDNSGGNIHLYRLFETGSKKIGTIVPEGGTPTVAALGATPMTMRRLLGRSRDSLIIHITDGFAGDEAHCGIKLAELVKVIKRKYKLDVYCLAITGISKAQMNVSNLTKEQYNPAQIKLLKEAYGASFTPLSDYEQLPEAMKDLLRNVLVH